MNMEYVVSPKYNFSVSFRQGHVFISFRQKFGEKKPNAILRIIYVHMYTYACNVYMYLYISV
jgi:hypothetical protein